MKLAVSAAEWISPRERLLSFGMPAMLALFMLAGPANAAGDERAFTFNLPRQELASAIDFVQAQTDSRIVYSPAQVEGIETPGLAGSYTADAALRNLLAGSGLTAKRDGRGTIVIVPLSSISRADMGGGKP